MSEKGKAGRRALREREGGQSDAGQTQITIPSALERTHDDLSRENSEDHPPGAVIFRTRYFAAEGVAGRHTVRLYQPRRYRFSTPELRIK